MGSELGQGRPQDWPGEMYDLARKVRDQLDDAMERGGGVCLDWQTARDVVTGLNVGGDAVRQKLGHVPDCGECGTPMNSVTKDRELVAWECPDGHMRREV